MSTLRSIRPLKTAFGAARALTVATALLAATAVHAEIIKVDDMLRGITITRAQCAATPQTVWVRVYGSDFCVRYYLSTAGGEGKRPLVFLQRDKFGTLDTKNWVWKNPDNPQDRGPENPSRAAAPCAPTAQ